MAVASAPDCVTNASAPGSALPGAKLVLVRRNPMDTCLGNFRQLFSLVAPNYDYSFDLLDTGRYYLLFDRLVRFWQEMLPGRILELHYEDVVEEQEVNTRRLLEFAGLPWNDACLAFERNAAPVATAKVSGLLHHRRRGRRPWTVASASPRAASAFRHQ